MERKQEKEGNQEKEGKNEGQKEKGRKRGDWREISVFLRQGVMVRAVK